MTEEELHSLRLDCYADPVLYARTFKRNAFEYPMSWVHRGLLAILLGRPGFLLNFGKESWPKAEWEWDEAQLEKILRYFTYKVDFDDPNEVPKPLFEWDREANTITLTTSRFIVLMMPRGIGKTTVVNLSNEIDIVYEDVKFLAYLSETATHANNQLGSVKQELEDNDLIRTAFGNLRPDRASGKTWSEDHIETTKGIIAVSKGRQGQVRGTNVNFKRPDKIVVDDVEDEESVSTEEQLAKAKKWFFKAVVPALPQFGDSGRIIVVGTLLDPNSLLMGLVKNPEWVAVVFGALDPEGEPIAPFYMTKEQFEAKKLSFARNGMLTAFYMEYCSIVHQNDDTKKFNIEKIRIQILERTEFLGVSEVIDPAISEEVTAAYCAIGVVGMTEKGHLHVLDTWEKIGAHPGEQVDNYFDMHFKWNPTHHGVEAIAYQAALVHLLQAEMFKRAKTWGSRAYFEIIKETKQLHGTEKKKVLRVEGILAPRYKAGYITHQRHFPVLMSHLNDWPLGKKDLPDVIAMCVALLDPMAGLALNDREGASAQTELALDNYEPLERVLGNYRAAP